MDPVRYLGKFKSLGQTKLYHVVFAPCRSPPTLSVVVRHLRRCSSQFLIVRGRVGGVHYHALAYIPDMSLYKSMTKCHITVLPIVTSRDTTYGPTLSELQETEVGVEQFKLARINKMCRIIPSHILPITSLLCFAVSEYFRKKEQRVAAKARRTKVERRLTSILDYLRKNYHENPSGERYEYEAWQFVSSIRKKTQPKANPLPLGSGF